MTWPIITGVAFLIILVIACWISNEHGYRKGYRIGANEAWRRWQKSTQRQDAASAWRRKGGSS